MSGSATTPGSVWETFKFNAKVKQPVVLRPLNTPWPIRAILAAIKAIEKIPEGLFHSYLSPDYNERIVEYAFVIRALPRAIADMRILDFGCGESLLPITLATMGAEVVGIDLLDYQFHHPNFSFRKEDFLDAEFPDAHFDAVVAVSSVEHVGLGSYGSPAYENGDVSVIREFRRVLRPGGGAAPNRALRKAARGFEPTDLRLGAACRLARRVQRRRARVLSKGSRGVVLA